MNFELLLQKLQFTHDTLHASAAKSVNISLTLRNWIYGYYIVEYEQNGDDRAKYGKKLLKELSKKISIKGISETNLKIFRQFYLTYPQISQTVPDLFRTMQIGQTPSDKSQILSKKSNIQTSSEQLTGGAKKEIYQTVSDKSKVIDVTAIQAASKAKSNTNKIGLDPARILQTLSFSHIVELVKIDDPLKRAFYEIECVKGTWSIRELQRQIESLYFERSGLSKDKKKLSELVNQKAIQLSAKDLINDPITIEFLGLSDRALVTESDLEQALLDHLQMFLLELGHGFCFEARQKRILIDDTYDFIDMVFYHRILKCHILVDLKTEKFKHGFVGQMNAYLNYYRNEVMQEGDNPPVGILLCTDKGNTMVKYATAGLEESIFVHKYSVILPSKKEIENYLASLNYK
ncbi:MAG: PDDEXK nuclease domain-containing protein [Bacteroidota bacterium]